MNDEQLWQQWVDDFKTGGTRIPEITAKTRRSAIELVLELLGIFLIIPAVLALAIFRTFQDFEPVRIFWLVFAVIILGISVFNFFRLRKGAFKAVSETPRALLTLLKKQEVARLRENLIGKKMLLVVAVTVTLWLPFKLWMNLSDYAEEPWRAFVGIGAIYTVLVLAYIYTSIVSRKKERALKIIEEIEQSFDC